jgi:hypothetical protein
MKIYLGFTVAGSRSSVEAAKKILNVLQSLGHEVLTSRLARDDAWEADRSIAPQKIFARDMTWLAQCELFVAEVTGSSFGLGFETGYLLGATAKKTILFFERDAEHRISLLITGNTHANCYWRRTPISGNWRSWFAGTCPLQDCPLGATLPERLLAQADPFRSLFDRKRPGLSF